MGQRQSRHSELHSVAHELILKEVHSNPDQNDEVPIPANELLLSLLIS